ncbi:MAG: hypothetical protein ACJ71B_02260 [Nitrososphaera sp.]
MALPRLLLLLVLALAAIYLIVVRDDAIRRDIDTLHFGRIIFRSSFKE